ncbi:hypothetical protein BH18THE2_BH18THE2_24590 [soil metagenome]
MVDSLSISNDYIDKEKKRRILEIRRLRSLYRNRHALESRNKGNTVIVIDNDAVSGATILVALK